MRAADVVVTTGCGDACPIFPGKQYRDWDLDDPAGKPLDEVRPIRDEIKARVEALLSELLDAGQRRQPSQPPDASATPQTKEAT